MLPTPLITVNSSRMGGAPVFFGTRVPIGTLFDFIADGATLQEFLTSYPNISREHVLAVLELARKSTITSASLIAAE